MSQDNVELVRRAFDALNRRDVDAFLEDAAPDLVADWSRAVGPQQGIFRGWDEVRSFLRSYWDAFEESFMVIDELVVAEDRVVTAFHGVQRGRASGLEVVGRGSVVVWEFRAGKILATTLYQQRDEALEAVGLPA